MKQDWKTKQEINEPNQTPMEQLVTSPECLSAGLLTICHGLDESRAHHLVGELSRQSKAIRSGDMARVEDMLFAQAHTLNALFAKLATNALTAKEPERMGHYMRLALRSQNQARATLQTLAEIKAPKRFVDARQTSTCGQTKFDNKPRNRFPRRRENQKAQNELLEANHGERLDTGAAGAAGGNDQKVEAVVRKHGTQKFCR